MATNSVRLLGHLAFGMLGGMFLTATPASGQQCTGGGWSAPADVRGPNGRRVMLDAATAVVQRDTVHVAGRFALEWFSDTAIAPTSADSAMLSRLRRTMGFRIDAQNRAMPTERADARTLPERAIISASADGTLGAIWSERVKMGFRAERDSLAQLRTGVFRNGRWTALQSVLPEMTRDLSRDLAITVAGSSGARVVVVEDAYPRFDGRWNEILLAHESADGWFYRRYLTAPMNRGEASVARLEKSGDIVVLGVVSPPGRGGFHVTSWRIPADSVRASVVPYMLGTGTELADLGNSMNDFPRLFAVGGDSVMAVWYGDAETAVVTTDGTFDRNAMRTSIMVVQLSTDGGRKWTEVFRRRIDAYVRQPVIIRDGRGGINLFYDAYPVAMGRGGKTSRVHLTWRNGTWQQITVGSDAEQIAGATFAATSNGLVALWASDEASALERMQLRYPRLRIARYEAPRCH